MTTALAAYVLRGLAGKVHAGGAVGGPLVQGQAELKEKIGPLQARLPTKQPHWT
ncbi:MAG: hypothetical protein WKF75_14800 [Singulisphaera sp.]